MNPPTIVTAIELHARSRAEHPALIAGGRLLTYDALELRVRAAARRLRARGVGRGDLVGVCLQEGIALVVHLLAILRLGAVAMPMDWRAPVAEQARLAAAFDLRLVLVEPRRAAPADRPSLAVDAGAADEPAMPDALVAPEAPGDLADAPALLFLSSGTTGLPKGVAVTHAQMRGRILDYAMGCGFRCSDRYLSVLPLGFTYGVTSVLTFLTIGATAIIAPLTTAAALVASAAAARATVLCLVPTIIRGILDLPAESTEASTGRATGLATGLASVRLAVSLSAPLHPDERAAIRQRVSPNFIEGYGTAVSNLITLVYPEEQEEHPGSVGRPWLDVAVEVVDAAHAALPAGSVGRVRCRGPHMSRAFHGDAKRGAGAVGSGGSDEESFRAGWYYPGDYGLIDKAGYLHLRGRRSDIVIRAGFNVYTPEVERVLAGHPAVIEAAVAGLAEGPEETLVAFVHCRAPVAPHLLTAHCHRLLAAYKVPGRFEFVEEIPRSSVGKVLKRQLIAALQDAGGSGGRPA